MLSNTFDAKVTFIGTAEVMFDRYAGDNKTQLPVEQKMYLTHKKEIYLPSLNLISMLSATNTQSAPKMFLQPKEYKPVADAMAACTCITPNQILFIRNDKPIIFGEFAEQDDGVLIDKKSGMYVDCRVARLDKGIPNPKVRPVLTLPWELKFRLQVAPHEQLGDDLIKSLLTKAGLFLGIGTYRKVYGKFEVQFG
jgi:hypothetical protein